MNSPAFSRRSGLFLVIAVALALRLVDLPLRYVTRSVDERPYVYSGLALWEGITPTYKYSPAGPQIWISWVYAAADSARYLIHPSAEERAAPFVLRPFIAGNHALFDIYRDLSQLRYIEVIASLLVGVAASGAAFLLGWKRGGLAPAILVGGMTAILPIFLDMSDQARPYMMGWGFAIISLYYAAIAADRPSAARCSAIFMGLAIASRIDMLMILPLAWADLRDLETSLFPRLRRIVQYSLLAMIVSLLVSPWILTNLIGNLRTIATVRIAEPVNGPASKWQTLFEIFAHQGIGVDLAMVACAIFLVAPDKNRVRWIAGGYVALLALSMIKATGFGLQHQGGPLVALTAFAGVGLAAVQKRWPRLVAPALLLALIVPGAQAAADIVKHHRSETDGYAADWIERHVPPRTLVYSTPSLHKILPTVADSDALWAAVNDNNAWTIKLKAGMTRFHITSTDYPRAFSEENMIIEKGLVRPWFILGSRPSIPDPRFDVHLFSESEVFRPADVVEDFKRTGGVIVCDDQEGIMPTDLGTPVVQWLSSSGRGVRIYCSPDMMDKLIDREHLGDW
jgi:hypothetical protein